MHRDDGFMVAAAWGEILLQEYYGVVSEDELGGYLMDACATLIYEHGHDEDGVFEGMDAACEDWGLDPATLGCAFG